MAGSPTHGKMTRADRALVATYHEAKLADLIEHLRTGIAQYDAGELSAFDVDALIHHYTRAARALWNLCGTTREVAMAAAALKRWGDEGRETDWWEIGRQERH